MSRLATRFDQLKSRGRTALIPFVTAGDPAPAVTVPLMHAMVQSGADVLELGIPFSDPMAEGPAIQLACERALAHEVSLTQVLAMVAEFRKQDSDTPVVLMGYLNPIEIMGYAAFANAAVKAGADGVITVDLPPEEAGDKEAGDYLAAFNEAGLDPVFLLAPTSTEMRIRAVADVARGFVYYVSLKGVTGASHIDMQDVSEKTALIRQHIKIPLAVGFGIKDAATATAAAKAGDAVVIGSAIVNRIAALADSPNEILKTVPAFLKELRDALDGAEVAA